MLKERMMGAPRDEIARAALHFGIPMEEVTERHIMALPPRGYGLEVGSAAGMQLLGSPGVQFDVKTYDPVVAVAALAPAGALAADFCVSLDNGATWLELNVVPEISIGARFMVRTDFSITAPEGYTVRTTFDVDVLKDGVVQWSTTDFFDIPPGDYFFTYNFPEGVAESGNWGLRITLSGEVV